MENTTNYTPTGVVKGDAEKNRTDREEGKPTVQNTIKGIGFKSDYEVMNMTNLDLEVALNKNLGRLHGYKGANVSVNASTGQYKMNIALVQYTQDISVNVMNRVVGIKAYEKSERLIETIRPFVFNVNEIVINEVDGLYIVELDYQKVFTELVFDEQDKYLYQVQPVHSNGRMSMIQIFRYSLDRIKKLNQQQQQQNNQNNNYRNNNNGYRGNNNNNRGNNKKQWHNNQGRVNNQNSLINRLTSGY